VIVSPGIRWDHPALEAMRQQGIRTDGEISTAWEASRPLPWIGITGTNGKTTCSQWIARALNQRGVRTAVVGTLGYGLRGALRPLVNTTPDALWLQAQLASLKQRGASAVSMEVSSIGLEQGRVAGVPFDIAVLTNLTRDHLDYHRTMAKYKAAKAKLELAASIKRRGLKLIGYGFDKGADAPRRLQRVIGSRLESGADGVHFDVATPQGCAHVSSGVLGRHNASNLLATLAVLLACDIPLNEAVKVLEGLQAVPGRMQRIGGGRRPLAVIDYAHSPDALENVLRTLRDLTDGELWCVFGCGGDRDRGKRPLMGEAASRLADRVIVTSDNPRFENPSAIIDEIRRGVRGAGSHR
jgi:UDP-N-acetylmuramoyl-L-alanyl-D-glutamate--2,6-diaminopimelate ligase